MYFTTAWVCSNKSSRPNQSKHIYKLRLINSEITGLSWTQHTQPFWSTCTMDNGEDDVGSWIGYTSAFSLCGLLVVSASVGIFIKVVCGCRVRCSDESSVTPEQRGSGGSCASSTMTSSGQDSPPPYYIAIDYPKPSSTSCDEHTCEVTASTSQQRGLFVISDTLEDMYSSSWVDGHLRGEKCGISSGVMLDSGQDVLLGGADMEQLPSYEQAIHCLRQKDTCARTVIGMCNEAA